jgi:poly(3-hydroxybutyrate) depolymerase
MNRANFLVCAVLVSCGDGVAAKPSSGCEAPTAAAGATNGSIEVNGVTRTYVLVVPSGSPRSPRPLVFGFHGLGGGGAGIRGYLGLESPAGGAAIFVYPDALSDGGRTGWDDVGGRDLAFFDALAAKVQAEACVDARRIFVTGFSHGGYWSNTLGCKRSSLLRAIAPLSGGGPWGACGDRPVAAWVAHGTGDRTVLPSQGQGSRDHWLQVNHCGSSSAAVTPSPCISYDGCAPGEPVVWCAFDGGHEIPSWVGGAVWSFFGAL